MCRVVLIHRQQLCRQHVCAHLLPPSCCPTTPNNPHPGPPVAPGALKTLFNDRGAMYGSQWTAEALALRCAVVVVDEADLLWQGGYVKDLTRLLDVSGGVGRVWGGRGGGGTAIL